MRPVFPRLQPTASLELAGGTPGVAQTVQLIVGRVYRLSCDMPIVVRAPSGSPTIGDLTIDPSDSLLFESEVNQCTVAAATDAVTHCWFQEQVSTVEKGQL